jgi:hypothetical protein
MTNQKAGRDWALKALCIVVTIVTILAGFLVYRGLPIDRVDVIHVEVHFSTNLTDQDIRDLESQYRSLPHCSQIRIRDDHLDIYRDSYETSTSTIVIVDYWGLDFGMGSVFEAYLKDGESVEIPSALNTSLLLYTAHPGEEPQFRLTDQAQWEENGTITGNYSVRLKDDPDTMYQVLEFHTVTQYEGMKVYLKGDPGCD